MRISLLWAASILLPTLSPAQPTRWLERFDEADSPVDPEYFLQDQQRHLWITSGVGLFRFDGLRFRRFGQEDGLPSTALLSISESPDGRIYAGTAAGLARWSAGRFVPVPETAGKPVYSQVWLNAEWLAVNDGSLHLLRFGPTGAIEQFTGEPLSRLSFLSRDQAGRVYFGCRNTLCRLEGRATALADPGHLLPEGNLTSAVDSDGTIWVRGQEGLWCSRNGSAFEPVPLPSVYVSVERGLSLDANRRLILTLRDHVCSAQAGQLECLPHSAFGLRAAPREGFRDRAGEYWFGMSPRGLLRSRQLRASVIHTAADPKLEFWNATADAAGELYVGTSGGLTVGTKSPEGPRFRHFPSPNGVFINTRPAGPHAAIIGRGEQYFLALSPDVQRRLSSPSPTPGRTTIWKPEVAMDGQRRIWMLAGEQLFLKGPGDWEIRPLPVQDAAQIAAARGHDGVWLAGPCTVGHLADGITASLPLPACRPSAAANMPEVRADGELITVNGFGQMFGTTLRNGRLEARAIHPASTIERTTRALALDARQRLWLLYGDTLRSYDATLAHWRAISADDLLPGAMERLNWHNLTFAPDGTGYLATVQRVLQLDPPETWLNAAMPPATAAIAEVLTGGQAYVRSDEFPAAIPVGNGPMRIRLAIPGSTPKDLPIFRYRWLESTKDWTDAEQPEIFLPDPTPGHHQLEIQGRTGLMTWGPTVSHQFEVVEESRFRRSTFYWGAAAVAALLLSGWVLALRTRQRLTVIPKTVGDGRYRLNRKLGEGGSSVVYLAQDRKLANRPVAVKILTAPNLLPAQVQKLLQQEIAALSQLQHPGIVALYDYGQTTRNHPFLVMEYIDGKSVRQLINEGVFTTATTLQLARQFLRALHAIHEANLYHRDLKPENLLVRAPGTGQDTLVITDFGTAYIRQARSGMTALTLGTVYYMPPEQGILPFNAAGDIFSFGIIVIEMLTQHGVAAWAPLMELPQRDFFENHLKAIQPPLPPDFINLLLQCTELDREKRPQSAAELARRFEEVV